MATTDDWAGALQLLSMVNVSIRLVTTTGVAVPPGGAGTPYPGLHRRMVKGVPVQFRVVGLVRIELTTSSLSVTRSNRLSYSP